MEDNTKSSAIIGFVDKNIGLIKKIEMISFSILSFGIIFYVLQITDYNFLLITGSLLTAISLFLQAFKIVEFEDFEPYNLLGSLGFINFIYKLYFFSLSISSLSMIGFIYTLKSS